MQLTANRSGTSPIGFRGPCMSAARALMAMMSLSFAFACAGPPGKDGQTGSAGDAGTPAADVIDYGVLTPAELEVSKMTAELTGVTIPADGRPVVTLKVTERHGSGSLPQSVVGHCWSSLFDSASTIGGVGVLHPSPASAPTGATLGGTLRAPQGHISVNARDLTLASSKRSQLPSLGLGVDGNWNG